MTAAAEWLEIETQFPVRPEEIEQRLPSQLPIGTTLHEVREAPWQVPSLAAQLQGAEYEVAVRSSLSLEEVQEKVGRFLATETWPLEEQRKGKARTSDLRKGVEELEVGEWAAGSGQLRMVLHHNAGAHARPDALVQALGLGSRTMVHRRRLLFGSSTDSCLGN
jgi:radical SAM-linked protein